MSFINPLPKLPNYQGPYTVGSTEYEIPVCSIDATSSPPSPEISTIKFRLFYPTTRTATSKHSITWVPPPQRQWIEYFSDFLGTSLGWSKVVNPLLGVLNWITIPAVANAPLLPRKEDHGRWPLAIFSHGLAGNCNTYSSICGGLASTGAVVAAVEHRDGSSPVSIVRGKDGTQAATVNYRKYSHSPTVEVFNARNAQLRTRMWELDLMYAALTKLDAGEQLPNYALPSSQPHLKAALDFRPGHISFVGHSFGAATVTQFVKSIYYHKSLPSLKGTKHDYDEAWKPLYTLSSNKSILQQITPSTPVALLDVWTLPFQAQSTQWLWEKPMPCYDRQAASTSDGTNAVAVMSTEFHNWEGLRNRTRALLSQRPVEAMKQIEREKATSPRIQAQQPTPTSPRMSTPPYKGQELEMTKSHEAENLEADILPPPSLNPDVMLAANAPSVDSRSPSPSPQFSEPSVSSSQTSLSIHDQSPSSKPITTGIEPKLFFIPSSAHLSQSDFGLLFPNLVRVLMKAIDPERIIKQNLRAITQAMRNGGVDVRRVDEDEMKAERRKAARGWAFWRKDEGEDEVVREDGVLGEKGERWVPLELLN